MRARAVALLVALLAVPVVPSAGADHVLDDEIRCDGGYCRDGDHRVLDCEGGACEGDARGFPTIVNPAYGDGAWLNPDDRVLVATEAQPPLAYPVRIMNVFETVHETVDGEPAIVTYCPLCASGLVFSRVVEGETLTLYNSGEIWNNDLVMYDVGTGSRFSQIGAEAIQGPRHGQALDLLPSRLVEWSAWKDEHPGTRVLERPVDEDGSYLANYDPDRYARYEASPSAPQGHDAHGDPLHPKTRVAGVTLSDEAIAFPVPAMRELRVHHVQLGDVRLVAGFAGDAVHVYEAGEGSFEPGPEAGTMVDEDGTLWRIASGESETGETLEAVTTQPMFWFAWSSFRPATDVVEPELGERETRSTRGLGVLGVALAGAAALAARRR